MLRKILIAGACAAGLAALVWTMTDARIDPAVTAAAGGANLRELMPLWLAAAALWAALTGLWIALRRADRGGSEVERARAFRRAALTVLSVAAAGRGAVLLVHEPTLSDDLWRYVFDGRNLAAGVNPYRPRPADVLEQPHVTPHQEFELVQRVNHPELHTIYLPASQWAFGGIAATAASGADTPAAAARQFRAVFIAVDLIVIGLILVVLRAHGRSAWWAALYAWHPLPIIEVAGSGHQDVLGIALLLGALVVHEAVPRRPAGWSALLAAAALVKPVALPVAPVLLRARQWRAWWISLGVGVATSFVIAGPLLLTHGAEPLGHLLETGSRFTLKWAHFGPVYEPVLWVMEHAVPGDDVVQEQVSRGICGAVFVVVAVVIYRSRMNAWPASRALLFALAVLSTTVHPWYLLWALALLPLAPSVSLWVASLTVLLSYAAWGYTTGDDGALRWGAGPWWMVAAWAPVGAAMVVEGWWRWRQRGGVKRGG